MKLSIKTKLAFGLAFLFGIAVLVGAVSAFYLYQLSNDARVILTDNYESIEYVENISRALDRHDGQAFEKNLQGQIKNVTEPGEQEFTDELKAQWEQLKRSPADSALAKSIRTTLHNITKVNMEAIVRKNNTAEQTADKALLYIGIIGSICFIITFAFIVNFPGYIANPIKGLTEGIKKISDKNYDERLHFESGDEFGELAEAFNGMAQKLDEYEHSNLAQILFEKNRIETIINKMNDPIIGLDEKKRILFANSEAIKILGVEITSLLGQYAPDVAVRNDLLRNLIQDIMQGKVFHEDPQPLLKIYLDGKESYFTRETLRMTSIPTGEKKVVSIGYVIILKNITAFKELDLAKTNFMATVSHELKTPIASIQMCSQLLEDERIGQLNPEQSRIVKTVNEETKRLLKITGELLDLAQVETGNIRMQYQSLNPGQIIDEAFAALKFQAGQKNITIEVHYPEGLPTIKADPEKTSWVLVNFLSNAIHYSPNGSKILMQVEKVGTKIVFSVKDFGKGIDSKHIDHVFDKFYKVPDSDSSRSGTGLGLAIAKDFITSQGGRIWAESEIGQGSTFNFEMPMESV
jgi:two-component system, NtrC family, sensor histidine kinase KinB